MEISSEVLFEHFHIIKDASKAQALVLHDEGWRRPIEHVEKFTSLSCEIMALGNQHINDEDKAFMLFRSLPNSLEHLVQTLMCGKNQLSFDDVYSALLSKDSRKMVGKTKVASTILILERGMTRDRSSNGKARGGLKGRSKSRGSPNTIRRSSSVGNVARRAT
ncbi:hypothetical protein R1flu_018448 [Riccia fluitans]|uniref:Uncharacterized protein n=1 Tax=Riccia fluitans TaxID=41844 RepID=A0ABD1ZG69_9MARC